MPSKYMGGPTGPTKTETFLYVGELESFRFGRTGRTGPVSRAIWTGLAGLPRSTSIDHVRTVSKARGIPNPPHPKTATAFMGRIVTTLPEVYP